LKKPQNIILVTAYKTYVGLHITVGYMLIFAHNKVLKIFKI